MNQRTYEPLDDLIDKSGLKYQFISKELNVSYNYFWRMRVDPRKINIVQMEKLANLLGVTFSDIHNIQKKFRTEVDKDTTNLNQPRKEPANEHTKISFARR